METADERHVRIVSEYEESKQKNIDFGRHTNVLIQMHLREPGKYDAEFIMSQLIAEHEKIGFDKIKSRGDGEE